MRNYLASYMTFRCLLNIIYVGEKPIQNDLNLESTCVLHLNLKHLDKILTYFEFFTHTTTLGKLKEVSCQEFICSEHHTMLSGMTKVSKRPTQQHIFLYLLSGTHVSPITFTEELVSHSLILPLGESCLRKTFVSSLVIQRLRIHLPIQETRVQSLGHEDSTCYRATKSMYHSC